jgi:hypothetical protein
MIEELEEGAARHVTKRKTSGVLDRVLPGDD